MLKGRSLAFSSAAHHVSERRMLTRSCEREGNIKLDHWGGIDDREMTVFAQKKVHC